MRFMKKLLQIIFITCCNYNFECDVIINKIEKFHVGFDKTATFSCSTGVFWPSKKKRNKAGWFVEGSTKLPRFEVLTVVKK